MVTCNKDEYSLAFKRYKVFYRDGTIEGIYMAAQQSMLTLKFTLNRKYKQIVYTCML